MPLSRIGLLVGLVVLTAGCGSAAGAGGQHSPTVASIFASPPQWPGHAWTRNGHNVPPSEVTAAAGPLHCGWQSATFLTIGWPLGTEAQTADHARQYIRDPHGVVRHDLQAHLNFHPVLPADARPTGYWYSSAQLYVSPSDADHVVYLVAGHDAESWPRSDPMTTCA